VHGCPAHGCVLRAIVATATQIAGVRRHAPHHLTDLREPRAAGGRQKRQVRGLPWHTATTAAEGKHHHDRPPGLHHPTSSGSPPERSAPGSAPAASRAPAGPPSPGPSPHRRASTSSTSTRSNCSTSWPADSAHPTAELPGHPDAALPRTRPPRPHPDRARLLPRRRRPRPRLAAGPVLGISKNERFQIGRHADPGRIGRRPGRVACTLRHPALEQAAANLPAP